jgi:hypothetical protein
MSLPENDVELDMQRLMQLALSGESSAEEKKTALYELAVGAAVNRELFCSERGEQAVQLLLQLAESSVVEPKVQAAALYAVKAVMSGRQSNQSAAGEKAIQLLLHLAESSGDKPEVQEEALDAFSAVVRDHEANLSAIGSETMSRLLLLAMTSRAPDVQKAALAALSVCLISDELGPVNNNRTIAGAPAVQQLLQLIESSGDQPKVQLKALESLLFLIAKHEENTVAAGAAAVRLIVQFSIEGGDRFEPDEESEIRVMAGQVLYALIQNEDNQSAALIACCAIEAAKLAISQPDDANAINLALSAAQEAIETTHIGANQSDDAAFTASSTMILQSAAEVTLVAVQDLLSDSNVESAQTAIAASADAVDQCSIASQQAAVKPVTGGAASPAPESYSPMTAAAAQSLPTTKKFALEALQARTSETATCDPARLHEYLSDSEFQKVFGMSAADFAKLPGWKQADAKKKHKLF